MGTKAPPAELMQIITLRLACSAGFCEYLLGFVEPLCGAIGGIIARRFPTLITLYGKQVISTTSWKDCLPVKVLDSHDFNLTGSPNKGRGGVVQSQQELGQKAVLFGPKIIPKPGFERVRGTKMPSTS